jgi:hypothetical protein
VVSAHSQPPESLVKKTGNVKISTKNQRREGSDRSMKSSIAQRFILVVFASCTIAIGVVCAFGDSPATMPTTEISPQQTLAQWSDGRLARMTIDQAVSLYYATNPQEIDLAKSMADQAIATAGLEKAVGDKWGESAKNTVAHICMDNTLEDDAQAVWAINGDHAIARFKVDGMAPLLLIRVQGQWKMDVPGYIAGLGNHFSAGIQFMLASTSLLKQDIDLVSNGQKFPAANDFNNYLTEQMNKLNGGN